MAIAAAQSKGAGLAGDNAPRGGVLRTEVALRHAIPGFIARDGVEGTDELAGSAAHAGFRAMANRRGRFVPDDAPADAGLRTGRLETMPAPRCPGRSLDQDHRESLGWFPSGYRITRILNAKGLQLTGQDTGETHQASLRMKNEDPLHYPISTSSSSLSFSGVGRPVAGSHPLAV